MVGALVFSPLADRFGRKMVIAASALLFGIFSLLTPLAQSLDSLFWLRFATGLGLGGAMPNAIALTSEFLPRRIRSTLTMVMFFGFSLGSGLGGAIAALLIRTYSWKAVFWFGGAVPLLLVPVLLLALPESIRVLTMRGTAGARVAAFLARINPALARSIRPRPGSSPAVNRQARSSPSPCCSATGAASSPCCSG